MRLRHMIPEMKSNVWVVRRKITIIPGISHSVFSMIESQFVCNLGIGTFVRGIIEALHVALLELGAVSASECKIPTNNV